ncbi:MAG TPA: alpha/beta hydrolase [Phycisphaerae bacterium]|nr:alpha/beta hydrolase [Phycisphaerae bacterium]
MPTQNYRISYVVMGGNGYQTLEHGRGLPLVMLHGMMGKPENWQGLFPHLPPDCRAIALRIPFFQEGLELNSVPAVTAYAAGYLDVLGADRVVLCGNSLGGHVALDLAQQMSGRVCGLVLTGSSGLFERSFGTVTPHPSRKWVYEKIREIFYSAHHASDELVDEVIEIIAVRQNVRALVKIAKSAKRDNVADRLGQVPCPSLLLWGRQDQITPPEVAGEFSRGLGNCELVWVDRCGHAPMIEYPQVFAEAVSRWWARHICGRGAPQADGVAK